jgi:hypothetical protein
MTNGSCLVIVIDRERIPLTATNRRFGMSSARTVTWVALFLATSSAALRADDISAAGNSWVFFGNPSTLRAQYPTLYAGTAAVDPWGSPPSSDPWTPSATTSAPPAQSNPQPVYTPPVSYSSPTPAAASAPAFAPSPPPTTSAPANAFINFGTASYPEVSQLTTGTPAPWYTSPSVTQVFGGNIPNAAQQTAFENQVLQDVQHTFNISGMNPNLTINPNVPSLHTLSVVSGVSYGPNSSAIGITDVGGSGFSFIDKLSYANNVTDLEWAVAHNISHELMHAFGIGYHPDQTGQYIDAGDASWSLLTSPNTKFSPLATQVISATGFGVNTGASSATGLEKIDGDQEILAAPVPEPATFALWTFALAGIVLVNHRRKVGRGRAN